jgi:hypothetical protein
MSIKIETEKVYDMQQGEMRRIIKITGVYSQNKLPKEYTDGNNIRLGIPIGQNNHIVFSEPIPSIIENDYIEESAFQKRLEVVKKCGDRLHEIMIAIKKRQNAWKGNETFII